MKLFGRKEYINDIYGEIFQKAPTKAKQYSRVVGSSIYKFNELEVGDAIKYKVSGSANNIATSARLYGRKNRMKLVTRFKDGVVTIYRIA